MKILLSHFIFFLSLQQLSAQSTSFSPSYIEGSLMKDNLSGGTSRYKSLSGAMSSLGGDLSAIGDNPAGIAVFNTFEGSVSIGVNSSSTSVPAINGRNSSKENNTQFVFNQIGGVFVFNNPDSPDWKSFSFGINSQNVVATDQSISVGKDPFLQLTQDIPNATRVFNGYNSTVTGSNYRTNFAFGANYQNSFYLGGSLDLYNSRLETYNEFYEEVIPNDGGISKYYNYAAKGEPRTENGTGFGLSLGLIYKPIQEVRFGISYKSPVWQTINVDTTNYSQYSGVDDQGTYYKFELDGINSSSHHLTTPATITLGGAYIFGKKGLLSMDYSLKDYRVVSVSPNINFRQENAFIDNVMRSTSNLKIGAEYRPNTTFTFRGGYSYEESPFNYNKLENYYTQTGARSNFIGDLTGLSFGLGVKLNGGWYLDSAYNYFTRKKELFIYGDHLDLNSISTNPNTTIVNIPPSNQKREVVDLKENLHNFTVTLGFRF